MKLRSGSKFQQVKLACHRSTTMQLCEPGLGEDDYWTVLKTPTRISFLMSSLNNNPLTSTDKSIKHLPYSDHDHSHCLYTRWLEISKITYLYWKHLCSLQRAAHAGWRCRWWVRRWCWRSAPCYTCRSCRWRSPTDWGWSSLQKNYLQGRKTAQSWPSSQYIAWCMWLYENLLVTRARADTDAQGMQAEFLCVL